MPTLSHDHLQERVSNVNTRLPRPLSPVASPRSASHNLDFSVDRVAPGPCAEILPGYDF
jgi:hypothetical protein